MVEFSKQQIGGIMTLLILVSSGLTYMIQDTGQDKACKTGWNLMTSGINEGKYYCNSSPTLFYWCYGIRDTANTKRYWCDLGTLINTIPAPKDNQIDYNANGKTWTCEGIDDYSNCISNQRTRAYAGELK